MKPLGEEEILAALEMTGVKVTTALLEQGEKRRQAAAVPNARLRPRLYKGEEGFLAALGMTRVVR